MEELKDILNAFTDMVAAKLNWLKDRMELKNNKKGYLNTNNADYYPNIPAVNQGLSDAVEEAKEYTDDEVEEINIALDNKVDKEAGKGLSENDFTDSLKQKLEEIESSKFRGVYNTFADLLAEYPEGQNESWHHNEGGWYADVGKENEDSVRYIWDKNDYIWIESGLAGLTPEQVRQLVDEANDSNVFTDNDKNKLDSVEEGAQKNVQSDWNESSSSGDAYIKNKPTKLSQFSNDKDFVTEQWTQDKLDEKADKTTKITTGSGLSGGGDFSQDREIKLSSSTQSALSKAHEHSNKDVLDGIDSDDIIHWDEAYDKAHSHDNKEILDDIDQDTIDDIQKGVEAKEQLDNHVNDTNNPHNVTASQVGSYTKSEADDKFATTDTTYSEITKSEAENKNSSAKRLISGRRLFDSFSKHITDWWDNLSISISKISGLQNALNDKLGKNETAVDSEKLGGTKAEDWDLQKVTDNGAETNIYTKFDKGVIDGYRRTGYKFFYDEDDLTTEGFTIKLGKHSYREFWSVSITVSENTAQPPTKIYSKFSHQHPNSVGQPYGTIITNREVSGQFLFKDDYWYIFIKLDPQHKRSSVGVEVYSSSVKDDEIEIFIGGIEDPEEVKKIRFEYVKSFKYSGIDSSNLLEDFNDFGSFPLGESFWFTGTGTLNFPTNTKDYGTLQNFKTNDINGYQFYKQYRYDDVIKYRRLREGVWGDWKTVSSQEWVLDQNYLTELDELSLNEAKTGTDTEGKTVSAETLNEYVKYEIGEYDANFDDYAQKLDDLTPDIPV